MPRSGKAQCMDRTMARMRATMTERPQAGHPAGRRRPRTRPNIHGFVNPPVYHASTVLYPNAADMVAHRARYQYGRRGTPTSEALENALREIEGPQLRRRLRSLPSGAAAVSTALLSVAARRRPHPGHRQRLSADAHLRRQHPQAARRRDDLLRSADRRRHRRAVQAEYARGVCRSAGLANLRDAGHSGDRAGRARQRRGRADGQYLGDAALFPRVREGRRYLDPGRHQIYRRAFRPDVRHGLGQCGDLAEAEGDGRQRSGSASGRTTSISRCAACARWRCGSSGIRDRRSRSRAGSSSGRKCCACCIRRSNPIRVTRSGNATSSARADCSARSSSPRRRKRCTPSSTALQLFGMGFSWGGYESLVILFDCSGLSHGDHMGAGRAGVALSYRAGGYRRPDRRPRARHFPRFRAAL